MGFRVGPIYILAQDKTNNKKQFRTSLALDQHVKEPTRNSKVLAGLTSNPNLVEDVNNLTTRWFILKLK